MAGHSHWANIKHKKAAADAKKAAVITRMAHLIKGAIQVGGTDPADNPRLRLVISKARAQNMTNDAINRIIKKAAGEGPGTTTLEDLTYEGYAGGGVAVVVEVLSNNRNRTAAELRKIFERGGGNMGAPGCVAWQFHEKSTFLLENTTEDAVMEVLLAAEADAEDLRTLGDGQVEVIGKPSDYDQISTLLSNAGLTISRSDVTKIPETSCPVDDLETAQRIQRLLEVLDEYEDVTAVHTNFAPSEAVAAQL